MEIVKEAFSGEAILRIVRGDITESDVEAIVNAANSHLQHGGGVAGALVRRGGSIIQEESNRIGYVPVGGAVVTTAGNLQARHVIHTVGPRWGEGDEEEKLRKAVRSTLHLASENGYTTVAMPAISAGIFGFPKKRCAEIMMEETAEFLKQGASPLREINFYLMDEGLIPFFVEELTKLGTGV